ncbi:MAG: hypothetical protein WB791_11035 [Waddliaceae bacterium]
MEECFPLSLQQRSLYRSQKDKLETVILTVTNRTSIAIPEDLNRFLSSIEELRIDYVVAEGFDGCQQKISPKINLNCKVTPLSKNQFQLTLLIPGCRLDALSCFYLAKRIQDYFEKGEKRNDVQSYIDFACWQQEENFPTVCEELLENSRRTTKTFDQFCKEQLLLTEDHSLPVIRRLDSLEECSPKRLFEAFYHVLSQTFRCTPIVIDVFTSGRLEVELGESLGMYESPQPKQEPQLNQVDGLIPYSPFRTSPFSFRLYPKDMLPVGLSGTVIPVSITTEIGIEQHIYNGRPVPVICFHPRFSEDKVFQSIFEERLINATKEVQENSNERSQLVRFGRAQAHFVTQRELFLDRMKRHCLEHPERIAVVFNHQSTCVLAKLERSCDHSQHNLLLLTCCLSSCITIPRKKRVSCCHCGRGSM